jgi:hypothetical protein
VSPGGIEIRCGVVMRLRLAAGYSGETAASRW